LGRSHSGDSLPKKARCKQEKKNPTKQKRAKKREGEKKKKKERPVVRQGAPTRKGSALNGSRNIKDTPEGGGEKKRGNPSFADGGGKGGIFCNKKERKKKKIITAWTGEKGRDLTPTKEEGGHVRRKEERKGGKNTIISGLDGKGEFEPLKRRGSTPTREENPQKKEA